MMGMNYWTQSKENIFVAAHRGWSQLYPENTMIAFEKALEIGVDQLETDIRVTKDGELILIHDNTVDRTTNKTGFVYDYTLEEIKKLDAGGWMGECFRGTQIPTFIEFMELVKDHPTITLDIELKEYPEVNEARALDVCDRVLKIIDEYGFTDRVVINSWSPKLNEYIFRKYGKKYRQHVYWPASCMTTECEIDPYSYGYCVCLFAIDGVKGNRGMGTKENCADIIARGCRPWAPASVKNENRVDAVIEAGYELITCNNPDHILALLREKGKHK